MNFRQKISQKFHSIGKHVAGWVSGYGSKIAVGLRYALSQGQPGRWASDHREESNHFTGWNYVAIHALAMQAAQADVEVFQDGTQPIVLAQKRAIRKHLRRRGKAYASDSRAGTQLPPDDRLVKLLKHPNPTQSGSNFRYEQIVQLRLTGTCIIWNVPNQFGLPVERYVIPTCMCYPVPPAKGLPRGGWRIDGTMSRFQLPVDADGFTEMQGWFRVIGAVVPAEQVQCIRMPHPIFKDDGWSTLAAGALWSDTAEQMDQSRWATLKQGPNPSLIISVPPDFAGDEEDLDEAAAKFDKKYGGPHNSGKAMFVTAGKVEEFSHSAKDLDYTGAWPQSKDSMLALHGTPPVAVGIAGDGSYAALYAGLKQYSMLTVQPILDMLAEDDTEHLAPYFGPGLTVEWTAAGIDDPSLLSAEVGVLISGGAITKGELRAKYDLPPFGDARDDEIATAAPAPAIGAGATAAPGVHPAAQPAKKPFVQNPILPAIDPEESDEETTGAHGAPMIDGAAANQATPPSPAPKNRTAKHFNQLLTDPVLKAAIEGALSGVESQREAVDLAETWRYNGAA